MNAKGVETLRCEPDVWESAHAQRAAVYSCSPCRKVPLVLLFFAVVAGNFVTDTITILTGPGQDFTIVTFSICFENVHLLYRTVNRARVDERSSLHLDCSPHIDGEVLQFRYLSLSSHASEQRCVSLP
jgi:hypothetical protein